jgi:hypothetical protein
MAPIYFYFVSIYTFLGGYFEMFRAVPFDFFAIVSDQSISQAISLYSISSISIGLGVYLQNMSFIKEGFDEIKAGFQRIVAVVGGVNEQHSSLIVIFWALLFVFSYGVEDLWNRDVYIPELYFANGIKLATLVIPIVGLLLGVKRQIFFKLAFFAIIALILLAASSRRLALFFAFFTIGLCINNRSRSRVYLVIGTMLTIWITSFVMLIRSNREQGLIVNITILFTSAATQEILYAFNYLTSFGVGLLAYSLDTAYTVNNSVVLPYSLSPLPSFLSGSIPQPRALLGTAPYSAFSILFHSGFLIFTIYFFIAGLVFGYLHKFFLSRNVLFWIALILIYSLFTFFSTQYDLRTATRFIYYGMFLVPLYYLATIRFRIS